MEQLLIVLVLILASGDIQGFTQYSKEWDSYKKECRKEMPKHYSNMHKPRYRDAWINQCARNKSKKPPEKPQ